jgi:hypothetical protein
MTSRWPHYHNATTATKERIFMRYLSYWLFSPISHLHSLPFPFLSSHKILSHICWWGRRYFGPNLRCNCHLDFTLWCEYIIVTLGQCDSGYKNASSDATYWYQYQSEIPVATVRETLYVPLTVIEPSVDPRILPFIFFIKYHWMTSVNAECNTRFRKVNYGRLIQFTFSWALCLHAICVI